MGAWLCISRKIKEDNTIVEGKETITIPKIISNPPRSPLIDLSDEELRFAIGLGLIGLTNVHFNKIVDIVAISEDSEIKYSVGGPIDSEKLELETRVIVSLLKTYFPEKSIGIVDHDGVYWIVVKIV